ncbi:hypothetical protein [Ruegeria arenilitoris]|uniref:hypothetical protein n=1 Tax=Ruegeria arenilitoris TaxID=1173585 RepID=UPI001479A7C4|nr:hypothetical protein [Ruegeria arenilitoris]
MSEAEVISACENVRRDFNWLVLSDPKVLQGALTVLAAMIAASTALYIALKIYPIQKQKDKDLQIQAETRSVYAETIAVLGAYFGLVCRKVNYLESNSEELKLAWTSVIHQQGVVRLYASEAVNTRVNGFVKSMRMFKEVKLNDALRKDDPQKWKTDRAEALKNCKAARKAMVSVMRSDLHQLPVTDEFHDSVED